MLFLINFYEPFGFYGMTLCHAIKALIQIIKSKHLQGIINKLNLLT